MAMTEKDLVKAFGRLKHQIKRVNLIEKRIKAEYDRIEIQLVEHFENVQAEATASYEGIGYVRAQKPRLYAQCQKVSMPDLIETLKERGREDLVQVTVNPSSLSTYIGECIENGEPIPNQVNYYLKPQLRMYGK